MRAKKHKNDNNESTPKDAISNPIDDISDLANITVEQAEQLDDDELESLASKKKRPKRRRFQGSLKTFITLATVCMSIYHLYTAIYTINPLQQRAIHLLFVMVLVFLLYPANTKSPTDRPSVIVSSYYGF